MKDSSFGDPVSTCQPTYGIGSLTCAPPKILITTSSCGDFYLPQYVEVKLVGGQYCTMTFEEDPV